MVAHVRMAMPLSIDEITYQNIQHTIANPDQTLTQVEEDDLFPETVWAKNSSISQDCLQTILPSNEVIIEEKTGDEILWEDMLLEKQDRGEIK
jgi:hypothetical protein